MEPNTAEESVGTKPKRVRQHKRNRSVYLTERAIQRIEEIVRRSGGSVNSWVQIAVAEKLGPDPDEQEGKHEQQHG